MTSTPQQSPKPIACYNHIVDPNYGSSHEGINHTFVSSQSRTAIGDNQFSLNFLRGGTDGGWEIADSRGSLFLLYHGVKFLDIFNNAKAASKPGLVVCEPTTRQYKEVPCRPEDLEGHRCIGLFLLHRDKIRWFCGGGISLSNFKVMAALLRPHSYSTGRGVPVACMFSMESTVKGAWRSMFGGEVTWRNSVFPVGDDWHLVKRAWGIEGIDIPSTVESFYFAGRACGSLYWGIEGTSGALVLDEATAAFSTVTLPEAMRGSHGRCSFRVIGGGALRVVRVIDNDLKIYARGIHGSDDKWAVERLVRLPEATRGLPGREDGYFEEDEAVILDANDTYVLLTPREKTWLFSVTLDTMEVVDRGHERNRYAGPAYPWKLHCQCTSYGRQSPDSSLALRASLNK